MNSLNKKRCVAVPRMAGVWGAGAPMVVETGVLGPVALIPRGQSAGVIHFLKTLRGQSAGVFALCLSASDLEHRRPSGLSISSKLSLKMPR